MMDTSRDQQNSTSTPFPTPTRKRKSNEQYYSPPSENQRNEETDNSWLEVCQNIKRMDALYDATFYTWLKSEENVFVTSVYLHRIANQYPLLRIMNGLKWLISDWHLESIRVLVEKVTQDWHGSEGDINRGTLLKHMTHNWAPQFTASLISHILTSPPYAPRQSNNGMNIMGNEHTPQSERNFNNSKARFLKHLTSEYDYSKLSEFLMYLGPGNNNSIGPFDNASEDGTPVLDHRIKISLLKDAARREKEREAQRKSANYNGIINSNTDSSDEIVDKKRPRLSNEEDEMHAYTSTTTTISSSSSSSPSPSSSSTSLFPMSSTNMNHSNLRMQANSSHTHTRNSSMSSMTSSHMRNSSMSSVNTSSSSITSSTSISTQEGAVSISSSQRPSHFTRPRRQGRRNSYSYNPMLILASAAVNEATTSATSPTTSTSPSNQNASAANGTSILTAMNRDDTSNHKSSVSTAQESNSSPITSTHHIHHVGISSVDDDSSMISGDLSSAAKRLIAHDI